MLNELLSIVEPVALKMKDFYDRNDREVSYKGDIDLVTQYDLAIEKELTALLSEKFPDFRIIGEESSPQDIGLQPGKVIYLDPIDGTTSFVHRFPFTAISVGVFVDKKPFGAVVASPVLGETYSAEKGKGAFCNGKPIKVSKTDKAIRSLFATGFAYDLEARRKMVPLFSQILSMSQGMRRTGSAAMDLCYVARGSFDLYYESYLKPWDMAAGILMVEEAGGKVTDINCNPHDLSQNYIIATNGIVHDEYLNAIKGFANERI